MEFRVKTVKMGPKGGNRMFAEIPKIYKSDFRFGEIIMISKRTRKNDY